MTYHHKRDPCTKETREILDNILQMEKTDYELIDLSASSASSRSGDPTPSKKANILPENTDEVLKEQIPEDLENYESTQELDFEVEEVKEALEKKKKRRNYVEFRPDYEKN